MSKSKFSPEVKLQACKDYLSGNYSTIQVCEKYGLTYNTKNYMSPSLNEWVADYKIIGEKAFTVSLHNKSYSAELKLQAVEDYLAGGGSIRDIVRKYSISSTSLLRDWILKYNANIELKDYNPKREICMAEVQRMVFCQEKVQVKCELFYITYSVSYSF